MAEAPARTAQEVAERLGWRVDTVYVNRRRSLRKLAAGLPLLATDLPVGSKTPAGLRWSNAELDRFVLAKRRSPRRGGRPRHGAAPLERVGEA